MLRVTLVFDGILLQLVNEYNLVEYYWKFKFFQIRCGHSGYMFHLKRRNFARARPA